MNAHSLLYNLAAGLLTKEAADTMVPGFRQLNQQMGKVMPTPSPATTAAKPAAVAPSAAPAPAQAEPQRPWPGIPDLNEKDQSGNVRVPSLQDSNSAGGFRLPASSMNGQQSPARWMGGMESKEDLGHAKMVANHPMNQVAQAVTGMAGFPGMSQAVAPATKMPPVQIPVRQFNRPGSAD